MLPEDKFAQLPRILAGLAVTIFTVFIAYQHHHGIAFFDATEYATHIRSRGVPHAPGYPLFIVLGKFCSLFTGGDPFTAQILLSWACCLGVVGLLWHSFRRLPSFDPWAACAVVTLFLSTYYVKLYTVLPEVFILNLFLIVLLGLVLDIWYKSGDPRMSFCVLAVYGLGFAHHHTLALTLPTLLTLAFLKGRDYAWIKAIGWATLGFAVGSLPIWYLFLASDPEPEYSYFHVNTWEDFLFMIFRKGYGTFTLTVFKESAPMSQIFALVGKAFVRNFNYVGLAVLAAAPLLAPGRGKKGAWKREPLLVYGWMTLFVFVAFFMPKFNIPLTFEKYRQILLRFVSFPAMFVFYPAYFALRRFFAQYSGLGWRLGVWGLFAASNVVGWRELRFRDFDLLEKHVGDGYRLISTLVSQQDVVTEVDPRYVKCAVFTRPDALVFGTRYYTEFSPDKRCFDFTMASFSGQFRAQHEEALQVQTFGAEYGQMLAQYSQNPGALLGQLFARLKARGFRIFLFYATDAVVFANQGFRYRPMGNIQELVMESDAPYPIEKLLADQEHYLRSVDAYLDSLQGKSFSTKMLDESVSYGYFQNMDEFRKLTGPILNQVPLLRDLDNRVQMKRLAMFPPATP